MPWRDIPMVFAPRVLAGVPYALAKGGRSRVTAADIPTIEPGPTILRWCTVAFIPIVAPAPTWE